MKKLNILIVEHHDFFRLSLINFLKNSNISKKINNIKTVDNPDLVLDIILKEQIDVLIIDLDAYFNTALLNKEIKKYNKNLKIIFYSLYDFYEPSLNHKIIKKDEVFDKLIEEIEKLLITS